MIDNYVHDRPTVRSLEILDEPFTPDAYDFSTWLADATTEELEAPTRRGMDCKVAEAYCEIEQRGNNITDSGRA